jgi:DNA-directed RNA polymerase specialized sigma24 family protein
LVVRSGSVGKVADEAIRQRRRRRTDDLVNAVAAHAAARSGTELADRRQRVAVVEVRRALRGRRLAEAAIASADERAAIAVRTLADVGLAQSEVAATCGVPLWTVRRLLALTKPTHDAVSSDDLR